MEKAWLHAIDMVAHASVSKQASTATCVSSALVFFSTVSISRSPDGLQDEATQKNDSSVEPSTRSQQQQMWIWSARAPADTVTARVTVSDTAETRRDCAEGICRSDGGGQSSPSIQLCDGRARWAVTARCRAVSGPEVTDLRNSIFQPQRETRWPAQSRTEHFLSVLAHSY